MTADAGWLARARHERLMLLLDLDGTYIPFAATPEAAQLDREGVVLLEALQLAGVQVVVVSGRPRALVDPLRACVPGVWWVAEHGAWRTEGDEWVAVTGPAVELETLVREIRPLLDMPGVRLERKTASLCVHWRQVPQAIKAELIAGIELQCDEWLEAHPEYERLDGIETIEVRRRNIHKGRAVAWVRERAAGAHLLAIGDDATDEDMFVALADDEVAISVGARPSGAADAWLAGPAAVRTFLWWLVQVRTWKVETPPPLERVPATARIATSKLVVVSNRTPPAVQGRERSVGGLVSVLEPALAANDGVWVGWSGQERDAPPRLAVDDHAHPTRAQFDIPRAWRDRYYSGFCNRALWPLFHGFLERATFDGEDWRSYVEANETFAKFAGDLASPGGTVWVHDYHLLLVARMLRRRGASGPLGLFLHIPFPGRDLFETLPWADELLDGMRAFDLVGFHTEQWADNFRACLRAQEVRSATLLDQPEIAILPMTIDAAAFAPTDAPLDPQLATLASTVAGRRLILGVDRLDYSKGIPERLLAFERLLERNPAWRRNVNFVQVSVPSRADVPEYAELRDRVEMLVGRINGQYGEADWVPVRYLYRSYEHRVLAQLYRMADVAMVTPLRDGLNLVAKEFVAAQDPRRPGVLVLSQFAGAAETMTDAVLTNPYHVAGLATDLERALRMPLEERRARHARLSASLGDVTPDRWAEQFLGTLARSVRRRSRAA